MKTQKIRIGKFYLSKTGAFIREAYRFVGDDVMWRDYRSEDGNPIGSGLCSPGALAQSAERELSEMEAQIVQVDAAKAKAAQEVSLIILAVLEEVTDEALIAEAHRRGLRIDPSTSGR